MLGAFPAFYRVFGPVSQPGQVDCVVTLSTPIRLIGGLRSIHGVRMFERRQLTHEDVRSLVLGSIELVREAQISLGLPLGPNILETRERLREGEFYSDPLATTKCRYPMDYGCFQPPSTIMLDRNLPFCDRPLDIPDLASTMCLYSAVHEILHADDYVGGDTLHTATREHMLKDHRDKLDAGMRFIRSEGGNDCIRTAAELADLSAGHWVDIVTHYRSYVACRYAGAPKLDAIWDHLNANYFPPNLLTAIEADGGTDRAFKLFTEMAGSYCLVDAFEELEAIGKKSASTYTV